MEQPKQGLSHSLALYLCTAAYRPFALLFLSLTLLLTPFSLKSPIRVCTTPQNWVLLTRSIFASYAFPRSRNSTSLLPSLHLLTTSKVTSIL